MRKGAAALRADGFDGEVKVLTSCPSCLQGLSRFSDDAGTDADYIVVELARRLQSSPRFALLSGRAWPDGELESWFARGKRLECSLVVFMCPAARNEALWRALLSRDLSLIVVRIDLDVEPASAAAQAVHVNLVQQFELDHRQFGFDHLLSTFHHLLEHHGVGDVDQLTVADRLPSCVCRPSGCGVVGQGETSFR